MPRADLESKTAIQSIYDGREWLADIKPHGDDFIAALPDGSLLGPFPDQMSAGRAVLDAHRETREAAQ